MLLPLSPSFRCLAYLRSVGNLSTSLDMLPTTFLPVDHLGAVRGTIGLESTLSDNVSGSRGSSGTGSVRNGMCAVVMNVLHDWGHCDAPSRTCGDGMNLATHTASSNSSGSSSSSSDGNWNRSEHEFGGRDSKLTNSPLRNKGHIWLLLSLLYQLVAYASDGEIKAIAVGLTGVFDMQTIISSYMTLLMKEEVHQHQRQHQHQHQQGRQQVSTASPVQGLQPQYQHSSSGSGSGGRNRSRSTTLSNSTTTF